MNPLTGLRGVPKQPVVVVKIDDTASGRPQIGLESADLVYVEQVEAGLTRLAAVFASRHPAVVGPVRSVRNSDPELLATYGRPALAYSGGAAGRSACCAARRCSTRAAAGRRGVPAAEHPATRRTTSWWTPAGRRRGGRGHRGPRHRAALVGDRPRAGEGAAGERGLGAGRTDRGALPLVARRPAVAAGQPGRLVPADGSGRIIATPNLVVPFSRARVDRSDVDVVGNPSVYTSTVGSGTVLSSATAGC